MMEHPELTEQEENQESLETKVLLENLVNQVQIIMRRDLPEKREMLGQLGHLVRQVNRVIPTV